MSHYGISAIHWNASLGEIDKVQLHNVVRQDSEGGFALTHGRSAWCADVANLIRGGDMVWVMVDAGPGRFRNTDRVKIDTHLGGQEYLYSCNEGGTPTTALGDLPHYRVPDDPPNTPWPPK